MEILFTVIVYFRNISIIIFFSKAISPRIHTIYRVYRTCAPPNKPLVRTARALLRNWLINIPNFHANEPTVICFGGRGFKSHLFQSPCGPISLLLTLDQKVLLGIFIQHFNIPHLNRYICLQQGATVTLVTHQAPLQVSKKCQEDFEIFHVGNGSARLAVIVPSSQTLLVIPSLSRSFAAN